MASYLTICAIESLQSHRSSPGSRERSSVHGLPSHERVVISPLTRTENIGKTLIACPGFADESTNTDQKPDTSLGRILLIEELDGCLDRDRPVSTALGRRLRLDPNFSKITFALAPACGLNVDCR